MSDGICPFAIRLDGPVGKTSGGLEATGVTLHSAEYDLPQDDKVLYNALFSGREASWHFTITKDPFAFIFQHYPIDVRTWHCGPGNPYTIGIEHEGVAPAKIEGVQYDLLVRLLKWIRETKRWADTWHRGQSPQFLDGFNKEANLYEHAFWMNTSCAVFTNGQIDAAKLLVDLREEDMRFLKVKGRNELYFFDGVELSHVADPGRLHLMTGGPGYEAQELPPDDPIWNIPVKYARVPDELR